METLAEFATGGIVMAPRLRTQLIAPQESAQWISDELPGNPRAGSMTNSVAVLNETLPHHCAVEFNAPAGKFYNGRSQQLLMRGPSATTRVSLTQRFALTAQQFS